MGRPVSFLPSAAGAALASVLLTVIFTVYIPLGAIVCGPFTGLRPDVLTGAAYFERPRTTVLSIQRDGVYVVGGRAVPDEQLVTQLQDARARAPDVPLELQADRKLPTDRVLHALAAARSAGYSEVYLFGHEHSLLDVSPNFRSK